MGSHRTPLQNRHGEVLRVGDEASCCTQPKDQRPLGNVVVRHQRSARKPITAYLRGSVVRYCRLWSSHALQPTRWIAVAY